LSILAGDTCFGVCRHSLMAFCTAFFPIHGCPRRSDLTDFEAHDLCASPPRPVRLPFACVEKYPSGQKIRKFPKVYLHLFKTYLPCRESSGLFFSCQKSQCSQIHPGGAGKNGIWVTSLLFIKAHSFKVTLPPRSKIPCAWESYVSIKAFKSPSRNLPKFHAPRKIM
jgi:hypothetical protein